MKLPKLRVHGGTYYMGFVTDDDNLWTISHDEYVEAAHRCNVHEELVTALRNLVADVLDLSSSSIIRLRLGVSEARAALAAAERKETNAHEN